MAVLSGNKICSLFLSLLFSLRSASSHSDFPLFSPSLLLFFLLSIISSPLGFVIALPNLSSKFIIALHTMATTHSLDPAGEVTLIVQDPTSLSHDSPPSTLKNNIPGVPASPPASSPCIPEASSGTTTHRISNPHVAEVRFQLSARHLVLASPVFKSMLSGEWRNRRSCRRKEPLRSERRDRAQRPF